MGCGLTRVPRYVMDHAAIASTRCCWRVVDRLVDEMAFPGVVCSLRDVGHTDSEIHYLLSSTLDADGRPRGGPSLQAISSVRSPGWRRGARCNGCERWRAEDAYNRPSRPFSRQPLGEDGSCSGCIFSHLDVASDDVEPAVRSLMRRGWSTDAISVELGISVDEVAQVDPPPDEAIAAQLERDVAHLTDVIDEWELRPERADQKREHIDRAWTWVLKLEARVQTLRGPKIRRGRVRMETY